MHSNTQHTLGVQKLPFMHPECFFFLRVANENEFLICITTRVLHASKKSPSLTQRPWPSGRKATLLSRSAAGSIALGRICPETGFLPLLTYPVINSNQHCPLYLILTEHLGMWCCMACP